jgi:arylsulfatase
MLFAGEHGPGPGGNQVLASTTAGGSLWTPRPGLLSSTAVTALHRHLALALLALVGSTTACRTNPSAKAPSPPLVRERPRPPPKLARADGEPLGVILVTVDSLRADYLSCYGHDRVLTPTFDRLASGGVLFSFAIAQSTTTVPSHASIMTSLYPQDHSVYSDFEALGQAPRTLAEVLAGRDFSTFAIVNAPQLNPEVSGLSQGFGTFVKSAGPRRAGPTIDQFLAWLDQQGERHFFAWLHLADTRTPYDPPAPFDRFYYDEDERDPRKRSLERIWRFLPDATSDQPQLTGWLEGITDLEAVVGRYQGAISYVDDELGRLTDALAERGLLSRTALVVTSDHGEALGEHDLYFVHAGLYEPTIRVPLIALFPGVGRHGVAVREVVEGIDLYPTILEYFGIPEPRGLRGRSLWPLIRGEVTPPRVAMSEHAGRTLVALRSDRFAYIKHLRTLRLFPSYPWVEGREELYDLKNDPGERRDVSAERHEAMRVFRKELAARRADKLGLELGQAEVSQETIERLRALGYVK